MPYHTGNRGRAGRGGFASAALRHQTQRDSNPLPPHYGGTVPTHQPAIGFGPSALDRLQVNGFAGLMGFDGAMRTELGAAHAETGTPTRSGAPLWVTPAPLGYGLPADAADASCAGKGRADAATGKGITVEAKGNPLPARVRGSADWSRKARTGAPLTDAEARLVAKVALRGVAAGARVLLHVAGRVPQICSPKYPADRTRSVLRLTKRVIGRPVGILGCVEGLRRIGWIKGKAA